MEYSPPPLFKQGPPAIARLLFFVVLAIVLLVSDARFNTLTLLRGTLSTLLYPLQRVALVPRDMVVGAANLMVSDAQLRRDNAELNRRNLQLSLQASQAQQLGADNAHLRALLGLRGHFSVQSTPVEIQYDTSDPFTQKIVIGHGAQDGIQTGAPVVTEDGVLGQVTRVFPLQSEVTLVTDHDLAIPVEVLRTGLRSVIYGTSKGDNTLDLRFVPTSADIVPGDELVTSGLDGIYPQGLPVAKVARVDRLADTAFARVTCLPLAAVRGARSMLVLHYQSDTPPRPADPDAASAAAPAAPKAKKGRPTLKLADTASKPASAPAAAAPHAPASAPGAAARPASHAAAPAATPRPAETAAPPAPPRPGTGGIDE
jgi:rod shape-determining protein MreC